MNRPLRVLVVEDNESVQRAIFAMLSSDSNITADAVTTIKDAEIHVRSGAYNVVLLDLLLPDARDLEGLVLLQKEFPTVPVVILSGLGRSMETAALEGGAQDYIEKPPESAQALIDSLRKATIRSEWYQKVHDLKQSREATAKAIECYDTLKSEVF